PVPVPVPKGLESKSGNVYGNGNGDHGQLEGSAISVYIRAMEGVPRTVGTSVPRLDGVAKVTGQARYVDDLPAMPGEMFGATVRSPVARGILRATRFDPAFDWSRVTRVVAEDIPSLAPSGTGTNVVALIVDDQPVLAAGRVNHAYEPV